MKQPLALRPFYSEGRRAGRGRTAHNQRVSAGLWVAPIYINRRAFCAAHETDALIAASLAGASDGELRQLVVEMTEARKALFAELMQTLRHAGHPDLNEVPVTPRTRVAPLAVPRTLA